MKSKFSLSHFIRLRRRWRRWSPFLDNHVGSLLTDHDDRSIRVGSYDRRHDRRVDDSQVLDPVNFQFGIHDRHWIGLRPHLARAHRVVDGVRPVAQEAVKVLVRERLKLSAAVLVDNGDDLVLLEGFGLCHPQRPLQAFEHRGNVTRIAVIVWLDDRLIMRIRRPQTNVASTLRPQEGR